MPDLDKTDPDESQQTRRKPRLVRRDEELPRRWRVRLPDGTLKGAYHESHIQDLLY